MRNIHIILEFRKKIQVDIRREMEEDYQKKLAQERKKMKVAPKEHHALDRKTAKDAR